MTFRAFVGVSLAATLAAAILGELTGWHGLVPPSLANSDFANYWIAARLILSNEVLDLFGSQPQYFRHMQAVFGADYSEHAWSYPPHYLLFIWPLGFIGYVPAMGLFLVTTGLLYAAAVRLFVKRLDPTTIAFAAPFAIFNIWATQNGFLTGALMLGALALRYDRPLLAGVLAGCLTIKPQLGVLLPVLYLIEGRWLTIAAAAATTGILIAGSAAVFGIEAWAGYVQNTFVYQGYVMANATGIFLDMMPSVFGSLRSIGIDSATALTVHAAIVLPIAAFAIYALFVVKDPMSRAVILCLATIVVTPYSLAYDLGAFVVALAVASASHREAEGQPWQVLLYTIAGFLPLYIVALGALGLPLAPVVTIAALSAVLMDNGVWRQLRSAMPRDHVTHLP